MPMEKAPKRRVQNLALSMQTWLLVVLMLASLTLPGIKWSVRGCGYQSSSLPWARRGSVRLAVFQRWSHQTNIQEYLDRVTETTLVTAVAPQAAAFRSAFSELLTLETCSVWSEQELSTLIMGASVRDDQHWAIDHLGAQIKAQHGYCADSRCFRDLLSAMADFSIEERRKFLSFVTGAPTLPVGGFAGLKPPLTVVKKESPSPPATPDQFMPSVMTCANYLKLPEYSSAEILVQKLTLALDEGQSAFLLS